MLRRIYIETESGVGGPFRPDQDTLNLFTTAVNFITSLSDENLDEFWLCCMYSFLSALGLGLISVDQILHTSSHLCYRLLSVLASCL